MRRDRSRRDDARQVRASCSPSPHSAPGRFLPRDLAHVVPGSPRLLLPPLDAARPPARASPYSSWTPRTRTAARSARSRSPPAASGGTSPPRRISNAGRRRATETRPKNRTRNRTRTKTPRPPSSSPRWAPPWTRVRASARRATAPRRRLAARAAGSSPWTARGRAWRWARTRSWTSWCARARTRTSSSRRWTRRPSFRATHVEPPGSARSPRPARRCSATKLWASQRNARSCAC